MFWAAFLALLATGCGNSRPETAPVSGRITVRGEPLAQGRIAFYPAAGRMAQGDIKPDGTYTLSTFESGDGAVLGNHRVVIIATRITGPPPPTSLEEELKGGSSGTPTTTQATIEWLVPEKYSEAATTPLTVEVVGGKNVCDFDVP